MSSIGALVPEVNLGKQEADVIPEARETMRLIPLINQGVI